jgi:CRP-like cAMP-binding protein
MLARTMRRRRLRAGQVLWRQGDDSQDLVFVLEGRITISLQLPGGATVEVSSVGPGEVMGEMGMIDGGPSPVTAITRERTLVLALPTVAFERLFNGEQPESHVFLDVIHRDLTGSLRQALRPQARLAVSL